MFLTGFIFGTVIVFMILREYNVLPPEGTLGCAIGAGILLGLFTMLLQHAGLFLTGFNLGVGAAAIIFVGVEQIIHPYTKWIPIGVFLVLGVLFGILSLRFQKTLTVISTSVFGAAMGLIGIDYFVEMSRMGLYIWDRVKAEKPSLLCWYSWLMFALWPAIASSGAIIQWKFTSYGVDHRLGKLFVCMLFYSLIILSNKLLSFSVGKRVLKYDIKPVLLCDSDSWNSE